MEKIKIGDFVYVIQNIAKHNIFEFCGIFQIIGHYTNDDIDSKYHFRFELSDITNLKSPIAINESECSKLLPHKRSNLNWSNFKLYFCEQGATFRKELDRKVLQVLDSLLPEKTSFQFAEEISADEEKSFTNQTGTDPNGASLSGFFSNQPTDNIGRRCYTCSCKIQQIQHQCYQDSTCPSEVENHDLLSRYLRIKSHLLDENLSNKLERFLNSLSLVSPSSLNRLEL